MGQGTRPDRVADQIRAEVANMIARDLHDPGLGFITITRVEVSADLQHARVYYSALGDPAARASSGKALERASSFMRRQLGQRLRLRRSPELAFVFDESIAQQDRIEQLLQELGGPAPTATDDDDQG
jgi:ribosome-binding factor A